MSNPNSPEARKLAKELSDLRKLQKASHIAPRLPYSSVPEGNLVVTDSEGNVVDVVGPKGNPESGDQLVLPGREPSKPSAPLVSAYLGTITATWDGSYVEEYVAPDLLQIEVHSSTDDDFESSAGTLVGTITGQRGGSVTLAVEYGTHYVRFVAVSTSGSRSVESDIASVEVTPLVETIEMTEVLDDIDQRFGGVITEAQQLNDKLAQAEQTITTTRQDLDNLETVRLPAVEANIEAAHQEITTTGEELRGRLSEAETDLAGHETRLGTAEQRVSDAFIEIGEVDQATQANATAASNAQTAADNANTFAQAQVALLVSRGQNLVRNGDFEAGQTGWNSSGNSEVKSVNARSGSKSMNISAPSINTWPTSDWVPSGPGRSYYVEYYIREGGTPDASGSVGAVAQVKTASGGTASFTFAQIASSAIPNFVFTKVSGVITPGTADIVSIRFAPWVQGPTTSSYDIDDFLAVDVTEAQEALKAAATAQSRADSAHTAAGNAQTTANNALTMAGTKSKVFYSTSAPSGTGTNVNDLWRRIDASKNVIGEWYWSGSAWQPSQITTSAIANLDVGKLTVGTGVISDLVAQHIAGQTAAFQTVDVKNLFATTGTMSEAVINKLWTDVIRSRKITTDQLLVGQGENLIAWEVSSILPDRTANFVGFGGGTTNPGVQANGGVSDGKHLYMVADWVTSGTASNTWRIMSDPSATPWGIQGFKVEPEEEFQAQLYVKAGGSYTSGMPTVSLAGVWYKADGTYIATNIGTATSLTWLWDKREVSLKAPATAAYLHLYVRQDQPGGVRVDLPSLYRKKGASLIVDGAIEAKHITASESLSAKVGQFLKLDVKDLVTTGTAKINEAVITKLWSDVVMSKKITADMVVIGGTNNLIPNANFLTDLDGWGNSSGNPQRVVGATFPYMSVTSTGNVRSSVFEVNGGGRFRFKVKAQAAATGSRFFVQINNNGTGNPYAISGQTLTTGWVDYTGEIDMPSDATTAYINIYVNHSSGITTTQRFANLSLVQMSSGELVVDGAITATKIATNAVEADKIKANAITADKIEAGAIKAQHISAKEITADKLRIGQGSNVFPDPLMQDVTGWNAGPQLTTYTGGYGSSNRVRVTAGTGQTGSYYGNGADDIRRFPVVPGRSYVVSVWVRPTVNISSNSVIAVFNRLVKDTGSGFVFTSPSAVYNSLTTTGVSTIPANTWVKMEGKVSVPADSANTFLIPGLYLQSGFPTGSSCDFSNLNISEAVTGELIVEGSITTDKLKADAIDGMTITGANIIGSRYQFNGAGAGNGYNVVIDNDNLGAYAAWEVPNQIVAATIRAFDNDPWSDYSTPTLTLRPPSIPGYTARNAVKLSAGIDGGTGGLLDVTSNLWLRGEFRGRAQGGNTYVAIQINDFESGYTATTSPSIKSMGLYNRTYTSSSNVYITANGYMGRATSLREAKLSIEDIPQEQIDALLDVNPRWWFDRSDSERLAEYLTALEANDDLDDPNNKMDDVPTDLTRTPGLVAEEVEEAGATAFVTYNRDELGNRKLSGVNYDRIGPALIPLIRGQRDKIRDLESRLEALEAKFQ